MHWSTTDEIRFINGLGNHRTPRAIIPAEEKLEFLMRYRDAMELRVNWGAMNSEEIRRYVDTRIAYYARVTNPQHTDKKEN